MHKIHINCDMAESFGNLKTGDDMAIMPYVDAVNIACGFHGGDSLTIEQTIKKAISLNKEIGAHPSYPDLAGFGRRYMDMSDEELSACVRYQICAVKSITESLGGRLSHVKPHGALYNRAAVSVRESLIISEVILQIDNRLVLYAQDNSDMYHVAQQAGLKVLKEAFGDRRYDDSCQLVSRKFDHAIIHDPKDVHAQVRQLQQGMVMTDGGKIIAITSDTICLHGDHPNVVASLQLIRADKT